MRDVRYAAESMEHVSAEVEPTPNRDVQQGGMVCFEAPGKSRNRSAEGQLRFPPTTSSSSSSHGVLFSTIIQTMITTKVTTCAFECPDVCVT